MEYTGIDLSNATYFNPDNVWKESHQLREIVIVDKAGCVGDKFMMNFRVWNGSEYESKELRKNIKDIQ